MDGFEQRWKVGDLAEKTGLSIRTLHYYEELGLLRPERTAAGHRRYGGPDLLRLQQILSLRQLGFSLGEIAQCLDRPDFSPRQVVEMHLARLDEHLELQRRLRDRLEAIAQSLKAAQHVSAESFIQTIEVTLMIEKHYTPEQLEQLRLRRDQVGQERIEQVQHEWQALFDRLREEMQRGTEPTDRRLDPLLEQAAALVREFTGGDPGITRSLANLYQERPTAAADHGMNVDAELMSYYAAAQSSRRAS